MVSLRLLQSYRRLITFGLPRIFITILLVIMVYFYIQGHKFYEKVFEYISGQAAMAKVQPSLTRGVVYFGYSSNRTTALHYVQRILESSQGIRRHSPDLPIMLFTNSEYSGEDFEYVYRIRDNLVAPGRQWWTRISLLSETRFNLTLSVDSDRVICNDISPIFDLLDEYDMLGVSAGILPGLDNGVMAYRSGSKFNKLVQVWKEEQEVFGRQKDDQQTLARAITKLVGYRVGVLDQSWQLKYIPAVGETWRNHTMARTLVVHEPIKISASRRCPSEADSSEPRLYMSGILTGKQASSRFGAVVKNQSQCDYLMNNKCSFRELSWASRLPVVPKEYYLQLYYPYIWKGKRK